jgi:type II secretory pathway pseudopilin PulG
METHPRLARPSRFPLVIAVIVVVFVMVISTTVTLAQKRRAQAEEARMREMTAAVTSLRTAISDFRKQRGRYPRALSELASIPRDPVTGSNTTWLTEVEESVRADDFTAKSARPEKFVVNVRSGAKGRDAHGKAWADY